MARYILTAIAAQDLAVIAGYIAEDNPAAAAKILDAMISRFDLLAKKPTLHPPQSCYKNLRKSKVGNYLIFYRPVKNGIEVLRVIHAARDVNAVLSAVH